MSLDEFTKFDFTRAVELDDTQVDSDSEPEVVDVEGFTDIVAAVVEAKLRSVGLENVLDGYQPHRMVAKRGHYYPKPGTIRVLPTGHFLFEVDSYESPNDKPVLVTLVQSEIEAIYWLPEVDEDAEVIPLAA